MKKDVRAKIAAAGLSYQLNPYQLLTNFLLTNSLLINFQNHGLL